jgi:hypothetical protein
VGLDLFDESCLIVCGFGLSTVGYSVKWGALCSLVTLSVGYVAWLCLSVGLCGVCYIL